MNDLKKSPAASTQPTTGQINQPPKPYPAHAEKQGQPLPAWLAERLQSCPPANRHTWIFSTARQLHAHRTPQEIAEMLAEAVKDCGRRVPSREIIAAVNASQKCAWHPSKGSPGQTYHKAAPILPTLPRWPKRDDSLVAGIMANCLSEADLWTASPVIPSPEMDSMFYLRELFPGNPLVCIGKTSYEFHTARLSAFTGHLSECQFTVPSPMTSQWGKTQDDKTSMHTLSNTGPRRFLVVEFDSGTRAEQASLIAALGDFAPLTMVLSSGGKSLHSWFYCANANEEQQARFFRYACRLGADPATWTRSQFVRLPEGWREDKQSRQSVLYFDPYKIES
jgi:hypothetical protein